VSYVHELLAEVRAGCPIAAQELADWLEHVLDRPNVRVGTAFGLNPRGPSRDRIHRWQLRDEALRAFAGLLDPDLSLEQRAAVMTARLQRYRPAQDERNPERLAMRRIVNSGADIPGTRQIRRIISAGETK
jgi:hypothetical protein